MTEELKRSEEILCDLQSVQAFLEYMQAKRVPALNHDLNDGYVAANIGHAAKGASFHLPKLRSAIQFLIEQHLAAEDEARAQLPRQGGEAVEVVGYLAAGTFLGTDKTVCDAGRLFFGSDKVEEVMTVAQHQRILAAATNPADQVEDDLTMVRVSRELLERAVYNMELAEMDGPTCRELRSLLAKP